MTERTGTGRQRRRWGWGKRILVGLLVLVLVIAGGVTALVITTPWYSAPTVADPLAGGRRVTDEGMLANYYPGPAGSAAVIIIGGSEGGLAQVVNNTAQALHREQGYTTLALSYWGGPGQPDHMEHLPVETFDTAIDWLKRQPEVDADRVGLIGTSKGGEAAVLMASRRDDLKAVVGYVPSHVVWAGINMREFWTTGTLGSTWSAGGAPLPYLPYTDRFRGGDVVELYRMSLEALPQHQDAIIPIENSSAPLLLVCGEQDKLWPSCTMSEQVKQRADAHGGPAVTVLKYADAGHMISGPPIAEGANVDLTQMGGTQEGTQRAQVDSWAKVGEFLAEQLG